MCQPFARNVLLSVVTTNSKLEHYEFCVNRHHTFCLCQPFSSNVLLSSFLNMFGTFRKPLWSSLLVSHFYVCHCTVYIYLVSWSLSLAMLWSLSLAMKGNNQTKHLSAVNRDDTSASLQTPLFFQFVSGMNTDRGKSIPSKSVQVNWSLCKKSTGLCVKSQLVFV